MNLPVDLQLKIVEELELVAQMVEDASDPFSKLYFFSASFGESGRILNSYWDPELALIHMTLQGTHSQINARLLAMSNRQDRPIAIPGPLWDALSTNLRALVDVISGKRGQDFTEVLSRFAELGYLTTGNGFYLYSKGKITI